MRLRLSQCRSRREAKVSDAFPRISQPAPSVKQSIHALEYCFETFERTSTSRSSFCFQKAIIRSVRLIDTPSIFAFSFSFPPDLVKSQPLYLPSLREPRWHYGGPLGVWDQSWHSKAGNCRADSSLLGNARNTNQSSGIWEYAETAIARSPTRQPNKLLPNLLTHELCKKCLLFFGKASIFKGFWNLSNRS